MRSDEIRETFLSFFEERGHLRVPSSSLVPAAEDTSTLLTVAGMQQFKPYFEGREQPPSPRLTSAQRTFRTVDIDVVGTTKRHLTCFEMLGNFSVGDYFKAESLRFGWELSTGGFGFDPERVWVTVFEGDDELGLGPDTEAIEIWREIGVPEERIVRLPTLGELLAGGPDRPVRALLGDVHRPRPGVRLRRPAAGRRHRPLPRVLEPRLHDLRAARGRLADRLPQRNIDTGLGLERMAVIQQGVDSVFDTDGSAPLIASPRSSPATRTARTRRSTRAMRIIADHARGPST